MKNRFMNDLNLEDTSAHGYWGPCQGFSLPSPHTLSTATSAIPSPASHLAPWTPSVLCLEGLRAQGTSVTLYIVPKHYSQSSYHLCTSRKL